MKIALSQLNYHIANFEENANKIIEAISAAKNDKADLIVFSELSVCGYPPLDLLEQKDFIESCKQTAEKIAMHCSEIAAIIGCPTLNTDPKGKMLNNSALFLADGKIAKTINKTLLPTYDIFDEYRYFEPNTTFECIEYKGEKFCVTICEDLWDEQVVENSFAKDKIYKHSPMDELSKQSPEFIINIAASPFSYNQGQMRSKVLIDNAKRYNLPIIYVNQIGANTELIFDGNSQSRNSKGELLVQLKKFEEDYRIIDSRSFQTQAPLQAKEFDKIEQIHDALILGIKDFFAKNGFKTATLGLSGGIDSAVVAALLAEAIGGENMFCLLMPSKFSSEHSISDAEALAENYGIRHKTIAIKDIVDAFELSLHPIFEGTEFGIAEENIQARIRGNLLMAVSNKFGNILANTSNKSEAAVGYSTLYGDMNGGFSILGDVYKSDVFALARYINRNEELIPENSIVKPPSAELRPDQKDTDSLPPYDVLDSILFHYIEDKLSLDEICAKGHERAIVTRTIQMVNRNEYKRFQSPPILRISGKAFGFGRRMPLVAKY